jgi:predicted secreted protein
MPTSGIINGKLLRIFVGAVAVAKATECQLSVTANTRGSSHKDSGGWEERLTSTKSWTMTTNGLLAFDSTPNPTGLLSTLIAGTTVTVMLSTEVTGDTFFTGTAVITKFDVSAANEEDSTFSVDFAGAGALTVDTVA